jgi:hypothetical protein
MSKFLGELPFNAGAPAVLGCVVYWAVGLNPAASRFGLLLLIIVIQALWRRGLGCIYKVPHERRSYIILSEIFHTYSYCAEC